MLGRALAATVSTPDRSAVVFWRYWTGSTVSRMGTAVTSVAFPLTAVLVVHASAFSVAAVTASSGLPWLILGFPAGVYVSRFPLRGMQIAMDLVRALAIGSIPVAAWFGGLTVAQLITVALIVGSATVIFSVANSTLIPAIVPREELTRRNSLTAASSGLAQLAGPGLGGVLVDVMGAASCMLLDAVSYLFSAVMLGALPRPDSQPAPPEAPRFRRQVAAGFGYIRSQTVLKAAFLLGCSVNVVAAAVIALSPLYIVRTLREPSYVLGLVYAAEGAGALVGAALAPRLSSAWGSAQAMLRCALALPLAVLLLPLASRGAGALLFRLGIFWFALTMTVAAIAIVTYRHRSVPTDKLPLVIAITHVFSWGGAPLGALIAGGLATTVGIRDALFAIAGLSLLVPLSVWTSGETRRRVNLEDDSTS